MEIATDIHTRYPDLVVETAGDGNKTFIAVRQKEMNTQCILISDDTLGEPQFEF